MLWSGYCPMWLQYILACYIIWALSKIAWVIWIDLIYVYAYWLLLQSYIVHLFITENFKITKYIWFIFKEVWVKIPCEVHNTKLPTKHTYTTDNLSYTKIIQEKKIINPLSNIASLFCFLPCQIRLNKIKYYHIYILVNNRDE